MWTLKGAPRNLMVVEPKETWGPLLAQGNPKLALGPKWEEFRTVELKMF